MFIKKELIKKINELSFSRHSKVPNIKGLLPVTIETSNLFLDMLVGDIRAFTKDLELPDIIEDLMQINRGARIDEPSIFTSSLQTELFKVSLAVQSKLFSIRRPLSDTFYETVELLKASKNSVVVGGCVRDSILGYLPKDFDFATDIDYDTLETMFKEAGFKVQEEGKAFLVMIVSKNGEQYEIANFRTDGMYEDGRRPESVQIGTIYDDAQRRDFTINALYFNLTTKLVQDPNGTGIKDILSKTLRFVGKPADRLKEDSLRAFRFYRFLKRLEGFEAHPSSLKAVRAGFKEATEVTTPERIRLEVEKMAGL